MGFLKTDYSEVSGGFDPLPVGKYECIISEVKVTESSTKKPMLKVTLTVRDDVDQPGQKRKFFDNFVEQENMMWKFNQLAKAAQLPEGLEIESLEDFARAIQYKPVLIKNKHDNEYNGEIQDRVHWYAESKEGGGDFAPTDSVDIGEDDFPF